MKSNIYKKKITYKLILEFVVEPTALNCCTKTEEWENWWKFPKIFLQGGKSSLNIETVFQSGREEKRSDITKFNIKNSNDLVPGYAVGTINIYRKNQGINTNTNYYLKIKR